LDNINGDIFGAQISGPTSGVSSKRCVSSGIVADSRIWGAAGTENVYSADIVFYESNNGPAITGYHAINGLIANLQAQWPLEFSFELTRQPQVNHHVQHISWTLGIPGQTPAASGMDIALIEDDKIISLHLFLDSAGK
jgi:hypothetical protein